MPTYTHTPLKQMIIPHTCQNVKLLLPFAFLQVSPNFLQLYLNISDKCKQNSPLSLLFKGYFG